MQYTKTMMCDPLPQTAFPCEIQTENPVFNSGDLGQAELENFSVADDGTTTMKGTEDWNGATFSSEREPYCPGYHQFTNWRDGDGMFDCRSLMGVFVFLGFLIFYFICTP